MQLLQFNIQREQQWSLILNSKISYGIVYNSKRFMDSSIKTMINSQYVYFDCANETFTPDFLDLKAKTLGTVPVTSALNEGLDNLSKENRT